MRFARIVALTAALALSAPAHAGTEQEVRSAYTAFVTAQNARDIAAVRPLLSDAPDFLWVSDGKSFWGREAMLERMASFQQAAVWRAEPDLANARVVVVDDGAAYLHMPLVLVIGTTEQPDRIPFLVSILFQRRAGTWKIAALFTTIEKAE